MKDILGPLRTFGVPAVAIPDIDILKDGGATWTDWLRAVRIPEALHLGFGQQRSTLNERFKASGKDMKTDGGIAILGSSDRAAANDLFDALAQYGLFTVRRGEVENWLPDLKVPGKKTDWTVAMLDRMGADANSGDYVRPKTGDVWEFMRAAVAWIRDPTRKGID
jgi:hypothetical protein